MDADTLAAYLGTLEARLAQVETVPVSLAYRRALTAVKSAGGRLGQAANGTFRPRTWPRPRPTSGRHR